MTVSSKIKENVSLAPYTTFKIGGPARYFAVAKTPEEVRDFCFWAQENPPAGGLPVFVLGGGSNVLISDSGFNGLVLRIMNYGLRVMGSEISCGAGVPLSKLILGTVEAGLAGFEKLIGIPGTVGGAVAGNVEAFKTSISDLFVSADVFDLNKLQVASYGLQDCEFSYRESIFKNKKNLVVLGAKFSLKKGDRYELQKTMAECVKKRAKFSSEDSAWRSAGCFFKNIEWGCGGLNKEKMLEKFPEFEKVKNDQRISSGFLIDFLGLKGESVGGAMVSREHANYILNTGGATAKNVLDLAFLVKEKVFARYGFRLEEEVRLIGFE